MSKDVSANKCHRSPFETWLLRDVPEGEHSEEEIIKIVTETLEDKSPAKKRHPVAKKAAVRKTPAKRPPANKAPVKKTSARKLTSKAKTKTTAEQNINCDAAALAAVEEALNIHSNDLKKDDIAVKLAELDEEIRRTDAEGFLHTDLFNLKTKNVPEPEPHNEHKPETEEPIKAVEPLNALPNPTLVVPNPDIDRIYAKPTFQQPAAQVQSTQPHSPHKGRWAATVVLGAAFLGVASFASYKYIDSLKNTAASAQNYIEKNILPKQP